MHSPPAPEESAHVWSMHSSRAAVGNGERESDGHTIILWPMALSQRVYVCLHTHPVCVWRSSPPTPSLRPALATLVPGVSRHSQKLTLILTDITRTEYHCRRCSSCHAISHGYSGAVHVPCAQMQLGSCNASSIWKAEEFACLWHYCLVCTCLLS